MFEKTVFRLWMFAVMMLDETTLSCTAVKYVTFAPVETLRLRILENTELRVWTFVVTMFADAMLARVDTVPNDMFALVVMTFVVVRALEAYTFPVTWRFALGVCV